VSRVFVKKEKEMAEKIDGWIYFQLNQHFLEENKSKRDKGLMYIGKVFFAKMSATATVALHIKAILCDTTQVKFF
jgi:hypothetical protein